MALAGGFFSDHSYITGTALVVIGIFGFLGSITGNLAKMMAALWDPHDLTGFTDGGSVTPTGPSTITQTTAPPTTNQGGTAS